MEQFMAELQPLIINAAIVVLTGIGTWVGKIIGEWFKEKINTKTKTDIVKTTCEYVQQVYKDLDGESKLQKAQEAIVEQLNEKGITITELEMRVLIESTVHSFKTGFTEGYNTTTEAIEEPVDAITTETDQLVDDVEDFEVEGTVDPELTTEEQELADTVDPETEEVDTEDTNGVG